MKSFYSRKKITNQAIFYRCYCFTYRIELNLVVNIFNVKLFFIGVQIQRCKLMISFVIFSNRKNVHKKLWSNIYEIFNLNLRGIFTRHIKLLSTENKKEKRCVINEVLYFHLLLYFLLFLEKVERSIITIIKITTTNIQYLN